MYIRFLCYSVPRFSQSVILIIRSRSGFIIHPQNSLVATYIRKLPNLSASSTQRAESSHNAVKQVTNRHTPIEVAVGYIRNEAKQMALDHERKINKECAFQPRLMDFKVFASVGKLITHKAIEYLRKKWREAER